MKVYPEIISIRNNASLMEKLEVLSEVLDISHRRRPSRTEIIEYAINKLHKEKTEIFKKK